MATRGIDEVEDVGAELGRDVHADHERARLGDVGRAHDRAELVGGVRALALLLEDRELGFPVRVAHRDPHQEAVELRLGQRVCAFELDGVLRRDDHERAGEAVGVHVDGHLALFHRLEECRRGLRGRAVDLDGEHDVREHAAGPELEVVAAPVPHRHAGDVGGKEVGSELDAVAGATDRGGDGLGERRLAHARDVLDEEVAFGDEADERQVDLLTLALDDVLEVVDERREQSTE